MLDKSPEDLMQGSIKSTLILLVHLDKFHNPNSRLSIWPFRHGGSKILWAVAWNRMTKCLGTLLPHFMTFRQWYDAVLFPFLGSLVPCLVLPVPPLSCFNNLQKTWFRDHYQYARLDFFEAFLSVEFLLWPGWLPPSKRITWHDQENII